MNVQLVICEGSTDMAITFQSRDGAVAWLHQVCNQHEPPVEIGRITDLYVRDIEGHRLATALKIERVRSCDATPGQAVAPACRPWETCITWRFHVV